MRRDPLPYLLVGAELAPVQEVMPIKVPERVSEKSGITPYAFSTRLLETVRKKELVISQDVVNGKKPFAHRQLVQEIAMDGSGSPLLGDNNFIRMWVSADHRNAASGTDYIWMYFGRNKRIRLWGPNRTEFPAGARITWDLSQAKSYLDAVNADDWDEISLHNPSGDGILIERLNIVHSNENILQWECNLWLDGSRTEEYGTLGLAAKILETKLAQVDNAWQPQIHWAAREIGKTDHTKYGTGSVWCSEFASWCLRKGLWSPPTGNIGSEDMVEYFSSMDRYYTKQQLLDGTYRLQPGDYVRWPDHSALFLEYLGDPANENTNIRTIDGNVSQTVGVRSHRLGNISGGGCTS